MPFVRLGNLLGTFGEPAGNLLVTCWKPAGDRLGTCWQFAGNLLRVSWEPALQLETIALQPSFLLRASRFIAKTGLQRTASCKQTAREVHQWRMKFGTLKFPCLDQRERYMLFALWCA